MWLVGWLVVTVLFNFGLIHDTAAVAAAATTTILLLLLLLLLLKCP
jgi:hypothetical protein